MSTEHCIGLNDQRSSSRVLKPPVSTINFLQIIMKIFAVQKKIDKLKKKMKNEEKKVKIARKSRVKNELMI